MSDSVRTRATEDSRRPVFMSKADMVTGALRELLQSGEFKAGDPLPQRQLAARFGVSATPVREALRRLEAEGLVHFDPHRSSVVVEVDYGETVENFRIRAALESLGVELAMESMTDSDIDDIEEISNQFAAIADDPILVHSLNRQFHFRIYETANAPLLMSLLRRLWQSFPAGPQYRRAVGDSIVQHNAIVDALRTGDVGAVQELVRSHIMDASADFATD